MLIGSWCRINRDTMEIDFEDPETIRKIKEKYRGRRVFVTITPENDRSPGQLRYYFFLVRVCAEHIGMPANEMDKWFLENIAGVINLNTDAEAMTKDQLTLYIESIKYYMNKYHDMTFPEKNELVRTKSDQFKYV
jgi:hypothetical protein